MKWTGYVLGLALIVGISSLGLASTLTGAVFTLVPSAPETTPGGTVTIGVDILLEGTFDPDDGLSVFTVDVAAPTDVSFSNLVLNPALFPTYESSFSDGVVLTPTLVDAGVLFNTLSFLGPVIPAGYGVGSPVSVFSFDATFAAPGFYSLVPFNTEAGVISGIASTQNTTNVPAEINVVPEPTTLLLIGSLLVAPLVRRRLS